VAKSVALSNGRNWKFQKDALAHFKSMLARYQNGQRVEDQSDHADLCALLERYDAVLPAGVSTKSAGGISHFSRAQNVGEGWATDGFHVHRLDGTSIDFSYIDAVTLRPK
jgi:hypothetical protein